ncbi:MAG: cation diffusion facilitator family transporter [Xenococcus sp. (in: cyanobacteria)]
MNNRQSEQLALQLSTWGALGLALLGIAFGLLVPSEAIMLDGFFSLISFVMAGISLWVAWLVRQPDDEDFQFGYASFEPLINLVKGLLIAVLSIFALCSAIDALLHGGRVLDAGVAVQYSAIAAVCCLIIALIQTRIAKKTNLPMVRVDAKNWFIDGVLSLAIGFAFIIVGLIEGTQWSGFIPYADPTVVTVIILLTSPISIRIILKNIRQLLLGSPQSAVRRHIENLFQSVIADVPCAQKRLRMTQIGRYLYLHIYWLLPENFELTSVRQLDRIRENIEAVLKPEYSDLNVEVIFTQDEQWFQEMNQ